MLLIPFVENAFKHAGKENIPAITVSLFTDLRHIRFEVSNYKQSDIQVIEKPFSGVGIENIRRRLELIYPGRHHLEIKEENNQFKVTLEIQP
jgi:LytS/YehU family sensor histidine kinase